MLVKDKKPVLLIVDDEDMNVEFLAKALRRSYDIKVSYSGSQALETLNKFDDIDLVLLDIQMPEMDGFEVAKAIKANEKTKHVPFIFLTGYDKEDYIKESFKFGAQDYIKKPINVSELFIRIQTYLENRTLQKKLEE